MQLELNVSLSAVEDLVNKHFDCAQCDKFNIIDCKKIITPNGLTINKQHFSMLLGVPIAIGIVKCNVTNLYREASREALLK